jgi:hypothetical protein
VHPVDVGTRPPRIQLIGLLPAVLKPCGPACAQPFMNNIVTALASEELRDTPAVLLENANRAHEFAERLFRDFGNRIRIEVVGIDSPRGIWLALRHRVGKGFAVVVDGREVVRDPLHFEETRAAVERAVRSRVPELGQ